MKYFYSEDNKELISLDGLKLLLTNFTMQNEETVIHQMISWIDNSHKETPELPMHYFELRKSLVDDLKMLHCSHTHEQSTPADRIR